jgi:hypothetical protein
MEGSLTRGARLAMIVLAAATVAVGCSDSDHGSTLAAGPSSRAVDARADGRGDGWAVKDDGIDVTADGGTSWSTWSLPQPASAIADIAVLGARRGYALAFVHGDLALSETSTGDQWNTRTVTPSQTLSDAQLVVSDGDVVGILGTEASNVNFSRGQWFPVPLRAASSAPAGGAVSSAGGRLFLSGGVAHASLFRSDDDGANWKNVTWPHAKDYETSGPVSAFGDGLAFVTTTPGDTDAAVTLITSSDGGATWKRAASVPITTSIGIGVGLPAASTDDEIVVSVPDGSRIIRFTTTGAPDLISPNGLPSGVTSLSIVNKDTFWATYESNTCTSKDEASCKRESGIVMTNDGGQTWSALAT